MSFKGSISVCDVYLIFLSATYIRQTSRTMRFPESSFAVNSIKRLCQGRHRWYSLPVWWVNCLGSASSVEITWKCPYTTVAQSTLLQNKTLNEQLFGPFDGGIFFRHQILQNAAELVWLVAIMILSSEPGYSHVILKAKKTFILINIHYFNWHREFFLSRQL